MLKQQFQLKLSQKLSPQQIQLMKLIQLPTQAFEQRVAQELEENPALEGGKDQNERDEHFDDDYEAYGQEGTEVIETDINVDNYLSDDEIPSYKLNANNYSADDQERETPYASGTSFFQYLNEQLNTYKLSDNQRDMALFLIGSLDDSGYLRRGIEDLVDDLAFTQNIYTSPSELSGVLNLVQELDPPGVGARDLQECLAIQLQRKSATINAQNALLLIQDHFDAFSKKHYDKLLQRLGWNENDLKEAIHEIEMLNPKPGNAYSGQNRLIEAVVPDFSIKIEDGELQLTLNGRNAPELHVSRSYSEMLKGYKEAAQHSKAQKDAVMFIKQKLDAAQWFIDAIKQRQHTLFVTMSAIMNRQKEYFLSGDERNLKPMILKDIADEIGMDISTVSRVANSKYVDTPYGTKLIKEFFSEAMKNDQGEDVSTREIKTILAATIEEEDKRRPLTDDKLAQILKDKGY
ncbi:MAG: RNA polymerase factor sigma-54, partial [Flavobacteriaceae bacterium]